jgi:FtsH-binding integral membrane protein
MDDQTDCSKPASNHTMAERVAGLFTLLVVFVFYAGILGLALYAAIKIFQTDMWWQIAIGIAGLFGTLSLVGLACKTKLGITVFRWIGYALVVMIVIASVSKIFSGSFWGSGHCTDSRYITC